MTNKGNHTICKNTYFILELMLVGDQSGDLRSLKPNQFNFS